MGSVVVSYERQQLIELLQRDAAQAGHVYPGQRPRVSLLRRRTQANAIGRGCVADRARACWSCSPPVRR